MDSSNLENILLSRDINPTAMRLLVLGEMSKLNVALSLNDLEACFDRVDRVTLYRTVKTFEKHKLVHSIDDGTGQAKYALCDDGCDCAPKDLHAHFHCRRCDVTFCMKDYQLPNIPLPRKFVFEDANLVVKGLCDHCAGR